MGMGMAMGAGVRLAGRGHAGVVLGGLVAVEAGACMVVTVGIHGAWAW